MPEPKGGGYILFESIRRDAFREAAEGQAPFSMELSSYDWPLGGKEMFLLSFADASDRIDCAALARRKGWPTEYRRVQRSV